MIDNPTPLSIEELKKKRFQTILDIHKSRDWWERQPFEILNWIKKIIPIPKTILDVGCGDGRWIPAILHTYPDVEYTGVDISKKHIEDCKLRWSKQRFIEGDFSTQANFSNKRVFFCGDFELIIFGGLFNPKMNKDLQNNILFDAQCIRPKHILITFDYASSGYPPWDFMFKYYKEIDSYTISEQNQDTNQIVMAHLYKEFYNES